MAPFMPRHLRARDDTEAPRISWFHVLSELKRLGWSVYRIAEYLDMSKTTVHRWTTTCPRHDDGEALLALWCHVTGKPRAEVPTRKEA